MNDERDEIDELLETLPVEGASELQMESFVLRQNGVTRWGMLRQALAEVQSRRGELAKTAGPDAPTPASRRRVARLRRELAFYEARARGLARDLELDPKNDESVAALEAESWMVKLARRALIERVCRGVPDTQTVESIMALPAKERDLALGYALTSQNPAAALVALYERGEIVELTDGTFPQLVNRPDVEGDDETAGAPVPHHAD
jgi:hypothetical protein